MEALVAGLHDEEHIALVKQTLTAPGTLTAALKYYRGLLEAGQQRRLPMNDMQVPTLTIYGDNDATAMYAAKEEKFFTGPYRRVRSPMSDISRIWSANRRSPTSCSGLFREHGRA